MGLETIKRSWSDRNARRSVYRILESNVLCSMATITRQSKPHINVAYFAYTKKGSLELFYLSYPDSLHSKNLLRNPSMGIAVYGSNQEWGGHDRGMQLLGKCKEARGILSKRAESVYGNRFRKYKEWHLKFKHEKVRFEYRFYRFVPKLLMFLDEGEEEYRDSLVMMSLK
jgi:uncharacterized protein YhbP (UPF0306 family)